MGMVCVYVQGTSPACTDCQVARRTFNPCQLSPFAMLDGIMDPAEGDQASVPFSHTVRVVVLQQWWRWQLHPGWHYM